MNSLHKLVDINKKTPWNITKNLTLFCQHLMTIIFAIIIGIIILHCHPGTSSEPYQRFDILLNGMKEVSDGNLASG